MAGELTSRGLAQGRGVVQGGGVRYVSPTGTGDGQSWATAGSFDNLSTYVGEVGPGGRVSIRMDAGDVYNRSAARTINFGGAVGRPVTIDFVQSNGEPPHATAMIVGTRTSFDAAYLLYQANEETAWDTTGIIQGIDLFTLNSGASHIIFRNLKAKNFQNVIQFAASITGITLQSPNVFNVRRLVNQFSAFAITSVVISKPQAIGFSARCINMAGASANWFITGPGLLDSARQDKDTSIPACIAMDNTASGLTINGDPLDQGWLELKNCHNSTPSYWNGDGISTEGGNSSVNIRRVRTHGHADGGLDLKSSGTIISQIDTYDNKELLRFWGNSFSCDDIQAEAPNLRGGNGDSSYFNLLVSSSVAATVTMTDLTVTGDNGRPLALFSDGAGNTLNISLSVVPSSFASHLKLETGTGGGTVTITPPL